MHQKLIPDPFLILVSNPKQPLHARNSFTNREITNYRNTNLNTNLRGLSKRFKKVNFIFLSNRMSSVRHSHVPICHAYVTRIHSYVIRMYSFVIRMSLVRTRMSSVCHSYVVLPWVVVHGKTTHEWHMDDIRVTYGWHTSTYKWHTDDRVHTSDIQTFFLLNRQQMIF